MNVCDAALNVAKNQNLYIDVPIRYKLITMVQVLENPKQAHSPTLETVQMVEETIRKAKGVISVADLKRRLPRKVNHNTLKIVLAYLQRSGKVEFAVNGVVWVFMPREDIAMILKRGRAWT
jgi:hypothetical protein